MRYRDLMIEATQLATRYKVVFGWKRHHYHALAGDAYLVDAKDEADAKRQVRRMLRDRFPYDPTWRVLYAVPVTAAP